MGVSVRTKKLILGLRGGAMKPLMVTELPFRERRVSEKIRPWADAPLYICEKSRRPHGPPRKM
jgi:hypothetical protein